MIVTLKFLEVVDISSNLCSGMGFSNGITQSTRIKLTQPEFQHEIIIVAIRISEFRILLKPIDPIEPSFRNLIHSQSL